MSGAMIGAGIGMAAIESAMDLQNNLIQGAVSRYWNRSDAKRTAQLQYRYNKKFNEWLIPFQLSNQYDYAERYARNTPSWNVQGLRRAGLNPILAASGGFSVGSSPSTSVGSSGSVTAPHTNLSPSRSAGVIAAMNGLKQNELLDAEIEGQKIRNANEAANRGLDGKWAAISRLISETQKRTPDLSSYLKTRPHLTVEKKGRVNLESFTDDERKALMLHDILLSNGYTEADARHEGGETFWEHLESAWSKHRRNVRSSR